MKNYLLTGEKTCDSIINCVILPNHLRIGEKFVDIP